MADKTNPNFRENRSAINTKYEVSKSLKDQYPQVAKLTFIEFMDVSKNNTMTKQEIINALIKKYNSNNLETKQEDEIQTDQEVNKVIVSIPSMIPSDPDNLIAIDSTTLKQIPLIYPSMESLMNYTKINYVKRGNEIKNIMALTSKRNNGEPIRPILLTGSKGTGKTLLARHLGKLAQSPVVFISCREDMKSEDYFGYGQLVNGNSAYILGHIPLAYIMAHKSPTKTCYVIVDEMNLQTESFQKGIANSGLSFDGLHIAEVGLTFKLADDEKIIVIYTANPNNYSGVYPLAETVTSRSNIIEIKDHTTEELKELIRTNGNISEDLLSGLIQFQNTINQHVIEDSGMLDDGIDTREVMAFCGNYNLAKSNKLNERESICLALTALYGKYAHKNDKSLMKFVSETIESCFGIDSNELTVF